MTTPQKGEYYYHYKHNPNLGVDNYCYEIIGIAHETETNQKVVIYKPMYKTDFELFSRPLQMFIQLVDVPQYDWHDSRFVKITNESILAQLQKI